MSLPSVMTIAGSDSGGGAGIQADLKTFTSLGGFGTSAITAVTSQNTLGVFDVYILPKKVIESQVRVILEDFPIKAIKTGMLVNAEIVSLVAEILLEQSIPIVIDPVMVSKGGTTLLDKTAKEVILKKLAPLATVITPNIYETEYLLDMEVRTLSHMEIAARKLFKKTKCRSVIIKGGHSKEENASDLFFDGEVQVFKKERLFSQNTHGTGCTFSAAIATELGKGKPIVEAISIAKDYVWNAIEKAPQIGRGYGPLNHAYKTFE